MKLAIIGSRDVKYSSYSEIFDILKSIEFDEVVSGGANGADTLAEIYASDLGLKLTVFPADWEKHGRAAGPKRNTEIANYADECIAFINKPLHQSKGTLNCVNQFKAQKKRVTVIRLKEQLSR